MPRWSFALALDRTERIPLYLQIVNAIAGDIRRGRLRPGNALPGTRTLAAQLGLHRKTVIAAYDELVAEGWVITAPSRGTVVAGRPLDVEDQPGRIVSARRAVTPGYRLQSRVNLPPPVEITPGLLDLRGGYPDLRLAPMTVLGRAYRRALRTGGRAVLGYTHRKEGHPRLRAALAAMLSSTRGLAVGPEQLLVTRGALMGISLAARALVAPGDAVVVERLGYRPAWEAFRSAGAKLVPIQVDEQGAVIDQLAGILERESRVRAIYVTPHHQFPTVVGLAAERRAALLGLAIKSRIAIIEDDYDHEFHYEGPPGLPLASQDRGGVVIYVGTLSKVLAPGLRLGYVAAPSAMIEQLRLQRMIVDSQGDQVLEAAMARGVVFESGRSFDFDDRPQRYVRLGFAAHTEPEIAEGVRRIAAALTDARHS
jgi:GntR family transcriptional regulator/MocR family aminotransferase